MALADPVMDAVLGGHPAAQHRSPGRGADRRRTEILRKIHALFCQPVQVRRPNLPVPRAAHGPIPHVVRHHHDNIRLICHTLIPPCDILFSRLLFYHTAGTKLIVNLKFRKIPVFGNHVEMRPKICYNHQRAATGRKTGPDMPEYRLDIGKKERKTYEKKKDIIASDRPWADAYGLRGFPGSAGHCARQRCRHQSAGVPGSGGASGFSGVCFLRRFLSGNPAGRADAD